MGGQRGLIETERTRACEGSAQRSSRNPTTHGTADFLGVHRAEGGRPAAAVGNGLTVVIPAYRAQDFICKAISSVLEQPDVARQVIVVVDGEFDAAADIAKQFPATKVIESRSRLGAQRARNIGLSHVATSYVQFLDADDFLEGPLLSGLLDTAIRQGLDVSIGPFCRAWKDGKRVDAALLEATDSRNAVAQWFDGRKAHPSATLWRTEFIREIGGWREGIEKHQDAEVLLRAFFCGAKVGYSRQGRGVYFQHGSATRISAGRDAIKFHSLRVIADWLKDELSERNLLDEPMKQPLRQFLYGCACDSYRWGCTAVGIDFEKSWRALGGRGHKGGKMHRALCTAIGLRRKQMLSRLIWRLHGVIVRGGRAVVGGA